MSRLWLVSQDRQTVTYLEAVDTGGKILVRTGEPSQEAKEVPPGFLRCQGARQEFQQRLVETAALRDLMLAKVVPPRRQSVQLGEISF